MGYGLDGFFEKVGEVGVISALNASMLVNKILIIG